MAAFALIDAAGTLGGTVLSDHIKSITLNGTVTELDSTAMGNLGVSRIGGLRDWSVTINWIQDFAAGKVDAAVWPMLNTVVGFSCRAVNAAGSATNPVYSGSLLVSNFSPIAGNVGDLAQTSTTWNGALGTLHRATSG